MSCKTCKCVTNDDKGNQQFSDSRQFNEIMVKIVNRSENELPSYQTNGSSGADIRSAEDIVILPQSKATISTGIYVSVPMGYEIQMRSRSGLASKSGIFVLNSPGTIDSDYRGELKAILYNTTNDNFIIKSGDRIAQLVLCPVMLANYVECDELDDTERGDGGFGHTGV